jgi:hypothetical protein
VSSYGLAVSLAKDGGIVQVAPSCIRQEGATFAAELAMTLGG